MNLAENLKKIRKENGLSQEQLAESLGVSRQSVSKWESNQAYPEMDKVLQIAKMFNLNVDDLLNQDIKEVNNDKQFKIAINRSIDDFLSYITKTIDMFSSMKWKSRIKCIFEQCVIIGILLILFLIIGEIGGNIIYGFISALPYYISNVIYSIFSSLYLIIALVLGFILVFHVFKVRYLDYYVVVKDYNKQVLKDNVDLKMQSYETLEGKKEEIEDSKIYLEKKSEKVIIRDPKHSEYRFISTMLKSLLFLVKCFIFIVAILFCISLFGFGLLFIISFLIAKTGLFFLGVLLSILACISINLIILNILFHFVFNIKTKKKINLVLFLISILFLGLGVGISMIGITNFNYINGTNHEIFVENELIFPMEKGLIIDSIAYYYDERVKYVEENRNDIKIVYKHSKYNKVNYQKNDDNHLYLYFNSADNILDFIKGIIRDLNNKEIIDYDNYQVVIYASKKNIETLRNNENLYYEDHE